MSQAELGKFYFAIPSLDNGQVYQDNPKMHTGFPPREDQR